eukprot:Gregarina_sp_Pseudo_9__3193@NODE_337_length_3116_cov_17_791355_g317_i0_p1_GENE_NODE_337_length_3116_cov_17_791355_g317_i0NODE_337_length_3116_cov_17_791355_g317_i0_p1_ORF_typecomplete_len693_score112_87RINGv/PF12906_7/4_9e15FHA/PF00498_26/1_2e02FHA/PF00498_26/5_7e08YopYscD_cpl/PF16697_5/46YopYscD_cpl/PF16697_5/0_00035YopYscD_cpl/PF16697_5/5e02FANCL_C/PF11793_8/0_023FHA_2/PF17913_1/9_2e02FHA_2/PF17913_1/0_73DUF587/PF04532_12/0_18zfRING_2/PF13639_6/0_6_NODE_337_length_3116_cov_17_791355_g317_i0990
MVRKQEAQTFSNKCRSMTGDSPHPRSTLRGPFIGFTLKTSTWVSNSHGLYDYESHNVSAKTYRCHGRNNVYRILRKGVDVSLVTDVLGQELIAEDVDITTIAKLTALEEGGYKIESSGPEEDRRIRTHLTGSAPIVDSDEEEILKEESRFWVVIRSLKDGSVPLRDGDTIKLGRFAFNVKQVVLSPDEERKVCGRSAHDEDDVATCETRRSETAMNQQLFTHQEFQGSSPSTQHVNGSSSMFGSGTLRESAANRDSDYNSYSGDIQSTDVLGCRDVLADLSSRSSTSSVNGTTDLGTLGEREEAPPPVTSLSPMLASKASNGGPVCRICLCEEEDAKNDPLVSPCKCNGSMKWIHLKCLRTWMEGRLNIKADDVGSTCFFWRPLECELCQEPYPTYVDVSHQRDVASQVVSKQSSSLSSRSSSLDPVSRALRICANPPVDSNLVELFRIPKPAVPFVILESKHQPSGNIGFHFLSFNTRDSVRLGRGHEADVRVADISVSRLHATLRYQSCPNALLNALRDYPNQQLTGSLPTATGPLRNPLGHIEHPANVQKPYVYIEDLKSKFGTLVAIDKPIFLYPRMMLSLQVGRTVLTLYVRKPTWSRLIPSCFHLYYKGLISKYRRRQTTSNSARLANLAAETDAHDVRLLETYLPMSLVAGHVHADHSALDQSEVVAGGNGLAVTAPLERALAPV